MTEGLDMIGLSVCLCDASPGPVTQIAPEPVLFNALVKFSGAEEPAANRLLPPIAVYLLGSE